MIDLDLVRTGNTLGEMTRSECAVVAAIGGHVDDFVFVGKKGNEGLGGSKKPIARSCSREDVGIW